MKKVSTDSGDYLISKNTLFVVRPANRTSLPPGLFKVGPVQDRGPKMPSGY